MKILYLVSGIGPPAGWGTEFIQDIIFNLSKKDIRTTVINPVYKHTNSNWLAWGKQQEKKYGVRIIFLEVPAFIKHNLYLHLALTPLLITWSVVKLLMNEKYDLIHEFSSTPLILLRSFFIKLLFGVPSIFSLSVYNNTFLGKFFWFKLLDTAEIYCIPSKEIIKSLYSFGIPNSKIKLVPPGIDLEKFSASISKVAACKKLKIPENKFIVSYFGSLTQEKGVGNLIDSAKLIPSHLRNKILIIIWAIWKGSNQHKKYVNLIKDLNLPHLNLEEKYVDIPTALSASDLVVLPQQTGHGATIPQLTLIEALASQKLVIATNILGNRDLFVNENDLIQPKNPTAISHKIIERLNSSTKSQELKIDLQDYELEKVSNLYLTLYAKIIKNSKVF